MGQAKREYERDLTDLLFGGPDDPCRKAFEHFVKIGGSEYRDQSPPSGKGRFLFESFDPRIESFETDDPDEILQCISGQLGCVRLVRMKKNEWSVEDCENIHGLSESEIPEESVDLELATMAIMGPEEYKALREKILGKQDDEVEDEEEEEEGYKGQEEDVPDSFDFSFLDELRELFYNSIPELKEHLRNEYDECSMAAVYWEAAGYDNRDAIRTLMGFAEAVS